MSMQTRSSVLQGSVKENVSNENVRRTGKEPAVEVPAANARPQRRFGTDISNSIRADHANDRKGKGQIKEVIGQLSHMAPPSQMAALPPQLPGPNSIEQSMTEENMVFAAETSDARALRQISTTNYPAAPQPEQKPEMPNWGAKASRTASRSSRREHQAAPRPSSSRSIPSSSSMVRRATLNSQRDPMLPVGVRDIDEMDKKNPLACSAYVNDIYSYYRSVEPKTQTPPEYMQYQTDINDRMRAILIDWLVEVHLKFKLMPETLYLTVNLIDRFLAKEAVSRRNLQLVGVTAMLIAAKYEEIWAPEVRDFVYISDRAYTRQQILEMEKKMLNRLGFNLTVPTGHHFLARFLKAADADHQTEQLASYLCELALPDYEMLQHSSSLTAAAAVSAALTTLGRDDHEIFPMALLYHAHFTREQLQPCMHMLFNLHRRASTAALRAVFKKFDSTRFNQIAQVAPYDPGE